MKIENTFEIVDVVSGLKIKVFPGKKQDRLHIERIGEALVKDRDFFFSKDGENIGTGSRLIVKP